MDTINMPSSPDIKATQRPRQKTRKNPVDVSNLPPWPVDAPPEVWPQPTPEQWDRAVVLKGRNKRPSNRAHPALRGRPKGFWYPDLIGVVPGYARTYEVFTAAQVRSRGQLEQQRASGPVNRKGVPDGYAFRKQEAVEARAIAAGHAEKMVAALIANGNLTTGTTDDEMGNAAIQAAFEIAAGVGVYPTYMRLRCARMVMTFCWPRPTKAERASAKSAGGVAQAFLDSLAKHLVQ